MRPKLDQNLPTELIDDLRRLGHDVEHVYTEDLGGCPNLTCGALPKWKGGS